MEIGRESDTQVGIDNISFRIKTTYFPLLPVFIFVSSSFCFLVIYCVLLSPISFTFCPFLVSCSLCGFPSSFVSSFFPLLFFFLSFSFLPPRSVFISCVRLPLSSFLALLSSPSCCSLFRLPLLPLPPYPPLFLSFLLRFSLAFLLLLFFSFLSSSLSLLS